MSSKKKEEADVPNGFSVIQEGRCRVLYANNEKVFYNKVQVMNRDVSIQCIQAYIDLLKEEAIAKDKKKVAKLQRRKNHLEGAIANAKKNSNERGDLKSKVSKSEKGASAQSNQEECNLETLQKKLAYCEMQLGALQDGTFPGVRVLEALSATGLRSIRYAQEISDIKTILANDILPKAYESIANNIKFNGLDSNRVQATNEDAVELMFNSRKPEDQFDVIDLDPYGAPTIFLDSAVQAVKSGGMLLVTCTDMADLCGNTPETAWAKYGSLAMKSKVCKEVALRTILSSLASHAARYGRYIEPLVSLSLDFYIRVVVRVHESRKGVKQMPTKLAMLYKGCACDTFYLQPLARQAKGNPNKINPALGVITSQKQLDQFFGGAYQMSGPIWSAPIHDMSYVKRVLTRVNAFEATGKHRFKTWQRMRGVFMAISEEIPDVPLHYPLAAMANTLHCSAPRKRAVQAALMNLGFRASGCQTDPGGLKTDAPPEIIWDIFRCWLKENPVAAFRLEQGGVLNRLLESEPQIQAVWTISEEKLPRQIRAKRFAPNPEKFWGPGNLNRSNHIRVDKKAEFAEEQAMAIKKRQRIEKDDADNK